MVLAVLMVGCGDDGEQAGALPERVERALPTYQYTLGETVCPEHLGMPPKQEARTKRRGERELAALVSAYRTNPDAVVETTFAAADGEPRVREEEITIRALLGTHLSSAEDNASAELANSACFGRVAAALRKAKESG